MKVVKKAVVATVSSDSHIWNMIYLQHFLEDQGFWVANLGVCTPEALVVKACYEYCPDLLVITSINGHGYIQGLELMRQICHHQALINLPVIIGGQLTIGGKLTKEEKENLEEAGFDYVFQKGKECMNNFRELLDMEYFKCIRNISAVVERSMCC